MHYIDESWTVELSVQHTGVNLATELEVSFRRWNLPVSKLVAATTDNARNIVLAIEMLEWQHFSCFAHTLQLGVQKAMDLPQVSKALARARRLVSHFNHSSKSSYIFRQKQSDLYQPQLNLVQDDEFLLLHGTAHHSTATATLSCSSRATEDGADAQ